MFDIVNEVGARIVMLNYHTAFPHKCCQLDCIFSRLVVVEITQWVKMRSDSNMRVCQILSRFSSGLVRLLFNPRMQLVVSKLNRSCRMRRVQSSSSWNGKKDLSYSIGTEVIPVHISQICDLDFKQKASYCLHGITYQRGV